MTDYIRVFNKKVKEMKIENPSNEAILALENWMREKRKTDYYSALDSFAYQFGIGIFAEPHIKKSDDSVSYIPCLKYYPDNVFQEKLQLVPLVHDECKTSLNDCYKRLAKGIIYELMTLEKIYNLARQNS